MLFNMIDSSATKTAGIKTIGKTSNWLSEKNLKSEVYAINNCIISTGSISSPNTWDF